MMQKVADACSPDNAVENKEEEKPVVLMLASPHQIKPATMGAMMNNFDKAFDKWDLNKNGSLSIDELKKAVEWLNITVDAEIMAKLDKDGDGSIDSVEFREAFYLMALKHADQDMNQLIIATFKVLAGGKDDLVVKMRQETADERKERFENANKLRAAIRAKYQKLIDDEEFDEKDLKKVLKKFNVGYDGDRVKVLLEGLHAEFAETNWDDFEAIFYTVAMKAPNGKEEDVVAYALANVYAVEKKHEEEAEKEKEEKPSEDEQKPIE